eukprot:455801-Pyramimonas_sp.AAC.1
MAQTHAEAMQKVEAEKQELKAESVAFVNKQEKEVEEFMKKHEVRPLPTPLTPLDVHNVGN